MSENNKNSRKLSGFAAELYEWVEAIAFALAIVVILFTFVFRVISIDGPSMESTLFDEDRLIVTNFFYTPEQGDVVVITQDNDYDNVPIIKRVIAVENQTIDIDASTGVVTVDGVALDESAYIDEDKTLIWAGDWAEYPYTVPEDCVFVLGDNRRNSFDSRDQRLGVVHNENILGKAILRIYPFDSIGGIR